MHFGPTSLRLTSVLGARLRRPKLRGDLAVSKQTVAGDISYVVKIPETTSYARYGECEYAILQACDGTRTAAEVVAAVQKSYPDYALSEEEAIEFLDTIDPSTWERSLGEKNLAILEKIREERRTRLDTSSLLYIYFSAWDPNRVLDRLRPYLRWMFTRGFVVFSLLLFAATFVAVASDWPRIQRDTIDFYTFTNKTGYDLWVFWFLLLVITGIHEFGHGVACKHYGGEVHQMGFMLIYFMPSFYTDCTDMHMFDRGSKRLWTIFAGMWIELVVCGLATLAWLALPPGSFLGDLAYKTLLLTGVSGVFFNLNPLMKFDGYYALSQFLEMESLREDSFAYLKAWVARKVFRQPVDLPAVGTRKKRIFLIYSVSAIWYGLLALLLVAGLARNFFVGRFGDLGYLLTAGFLYLILRKRIPKAIAAAKSALPTVKEKLMAWRMKGWQKAGAFGALVLLLAPVFPARVAMDFVLEPGSLTDARAISPGVITKVAVREGQVVEPGEILALLHNPEEEARPHLLRAKLALAERTLLLARSRGDLGLEQNQRSEVESIRTDLARADERAGSLTLRAASGGIVVTPMVEQKTGSYLEEGQALATIVDRNTMRARILVRDWELQDVSVGAPVRLSVRSYPMRSFAGRVRQILPAAAADRPVSTPGKLERRGQELSNFIAVVMDFPNPDGALREGMTGTAKIYGARSPLAWQGLRGGWRWLRSLVW